MSAKTGSTGPVKLGSPDINIEKCAVKKRMSSFYVAIARGDKENEDFNIIASISQVTPIQEVSLEDPLPSEIQLEPVDSSINHEVTCEVVPGATKQGKNRLVDDDGYTYVLRRVWPSGKIAWRCSVRSKSLSCNASIQQDGQTFRRGYQPHCHLGKPGIALTSKMYVDIKRKATDDVFKSASNIVENVIREYSAEVQSQPSCSQPRVASLVRQANRHRQKLRLRLTSAALLKAVGHLNGAHKS
eukprot:gene17332-biopygen14905